MSKFFYEFWIPILVLFKNILFDMLWIIKFVYHQTIFTLKFKVVGHVANLLHIAPGALFMILGSLQFIPRIRLKHIQFHRWSGRVFIMAAYTIGITSIVLSFIKQLILGINEAVASIFFSIFFVVCVSMSLHSILRKPVLLHREWMICAFSLGLAIATVRIITAFAFIFFKMQPENFLGTAFEWDLPCMLY